MPGISKYAPVEAHERKENPHPQYARTADLQPIIARFATTGRGAKGEKGDKGDPGIPGEDGVDGGGSPPTGTGFRHVTGGAEDAASKLVENADVHAAAAIAESKLALNFATHSNALDHSNTNDPSAGEKAALAGTSGTPGGGNKYVTDGDARNTDARTPTAHTHGTTGIDDDAITLAKMANLATDRLIGRATAGTGDPEAITCTAAGRALLDDADATAQRSTLSLGALATLATVGSAQIDNDAVTYAKLQNVSAASRLLGRGSAGGAGDPEEITLGSGLSMANAVLSASGSGDTILRKTGNQQITSAGFVDITDLTFAVSANTTYHFEAFVIFQSSATAMGVLFGVNGPAITLLFARSQKQITVSGTASTDMFSEAMLTAYDTPLPNSTAEPANNANLLWMVRGVIRCSAGGTFALRFSKENVAGTATIIAESFLKYRQIS
jgi:hypothetical protein